MSEPPEADIRAFWAWFESVSSRLAESFDEKGMVAALDERVAELAELDEDTRYSAAIVVLDGLLGEERRMDVVDEVSVVTELEGEYAASTRDLVELIGVLGVRH